ncbi:hypothetical protein M9458_052330, partial [Cirrhinus mrigala]
MIDSGAALNLIHKDIVSKYNIPTQPCIPPIQINAINDTLIDHGITSQTKTLKLQVGLLHQENITLYIVDSPKYEVILGFPWLSIHNPTISWYRDLLPNAMPPKSKVYPLSRTEDQAMEEYIKEALDSGFICPSTSPAAAGFFFVIPSALEQLREFFFFQAVTEWPQPTTIKELQRFLGFANFYRRFIRNYSTVASPLTSLLKDKPSKLKWTEEANQAFVSLKERFTTAPILRHPDPNLPFVIEVDASDCGIGAVLSQRHGQPGKLHPCAFYSRKLTSAERNYDVGNKELLSMKAAIEEWRHWLEGALHPFQVITDHKNLEYIKGAKRLNPRQARWALFFTRFNFTVTYRPGSRNSKGDALSRRHDFPTDSLKPEPILPPTVILAPSTWDIMDEIHCEQEQDPPPPQCPPNKRYIPQRLRPRVLQWVHTSLSAGHPGIS